ncbi:MAG: type I 3-dehydroquinate dehydratase [Candidatus Gracilibacteria bacterium]
MDIRKTSILPLRCLCLPDESVVNILKYLKKIKKNTCDMVEIGIDTLNKSEWESSIRTIKSTTEIPLILAARGKKLTSKTKEIYQAAAKEDWEWVDVDGRSDKKIIKDLVEKLPHSVHLILSVHLATTPPVATTRKWIEDMRKLGKKAPTVPKIVTTIKRSWDIFRLLQGIQEYEEKNIGIVLHGQGPESKESRELQAIAGSSIIYLCLSEKLATGKGQWTIEAWNRRIRTL